VSAVDSKQMLLRVIGKRNKQRALPLAEPSLAMSAKSDSPWRTSRGLEDPSQPQVALPQPQRHFPSVP
jgi:site-specific recombinase XerD